MLDFQFFLCSPEKLKIAKKALKFYANIDVWQYKETADRYTNFELKDSNGEIRDGWEWADEALAALENCEDTDVPYGKYARTINE